MGLTFFGTVVIVCGICLLIAFTRRGSVASVRLGGRVETFHSPLDPDAVFAVIARGVHPFKHEDSDAGSRLIVLGSNPTFATWGFFYPISIDPAPAGGSVVRVGIQSKVFQWGPLVTRWHHKCKSEIERAVNAELPSARVVG
jgi:hypothetical protein